MFKQKRFIITLILILIFITLFRLVWFQLIGGLDVKDQPFIEKGVLDLREYELSSYKTFKLDGEWEFYPDKLLTEKTVNNDKQYTVVPHTWNEKYFKKSNSKFQYGTYRLKILLNSDHHNEEDLGIRINGIERSSAVYANGELIKKTGNPANNLDDYIPKDVPSNILVPIKNDEIDLIIQVANHTNSGGIVKKIRFGTMEAINNRFLISISSQLFLIFLFFINSIYALILYFIGNKNKEIFYFFVVMILGIFTVATVDDKILYLLIDFDYNWSVKFMMLVYILAISMSPIPTNYMFPNYIKKKTLTNYKKSLFILSLFILLSPTEWLLSLKLIIGLLMIYPSILTAYIVSKASIDRQDTHFIIYGAVVLTVNIIWSLIFGLNYIDFITYPIDFAFAIICIPIYWFYQFFKVKEDAEKLSEKLQIEDKRKDEFLISTSHELRNPLHGIINITQSMQNDIENPLSSKQKRRTTLLIHISNHLSMLVDDLLDISKLNDNAIKLRVEKVNLLTIVNGVYDMVSLSLGNKPVKMVIDIADNIPLIWADKQRLTQIIYNILHNAVKFTQVGQITTRAKVKNNNIFIEIEDTGMGISKNDLPNIFKPYEQGNISQSINMVEGIGYGLYICKRLVELHGGEINVSSVIDKGSVFTIKLPLVNGSAKYSGQMIEDVETSNIMSSYEDNFKHVDSNNYTFYNLNTLTEVEKGNETKQRDSYQATILIVEDDHINLNIYSEILQSEKYSVKTASDVKTALDIIDEFSIDLIITDIMMPVISGYEFTKRVRERYTLIELPILLVTARATSEDIITGFKVGANDYLTKPVNSLELKSRVRTLINLKRAKEEHDQMQGAWLQAQIQPHFIFNTLNSIAALGIIDNTKMQKLLQEFSNYLRISFDFKNSNPVVELKHELELVKSYIYIEQERFEDRLKVDWDIDDNINFYIPPLSIQPLVENAINHGILKKIDGGTLRIEIKEENLFYKVVVTDNGVGMNEDALNNLFTQEGEYTPSVRRGIGLRNINKRLKQIYDQKLIIKSKQNEGTVVSFSVPKNEKSEN